MLTATLVQALARHLLTAVGGSFLMSFGITGTSLDAAIGALSTLAGVAWSVYDKKQQASQNQPAEQPQQ